MGRLLDSYYAWVTRWIPSVSQPTLNTYIEYLRVLMLIICVVSMAFISIVTVELARATRMPLPSPYDGLILGAHIVALLAEGLILSMSIFGCCQRDACTLSYEYSYVAVRDLLFTIALGIAIIIQRYGPAPISSCYIEKELYIKKFGGDGENHGQSCQRFVNEWSWEISTLTLLALVTYLELYFTSWTQAKLRWDAPWHVFCHFLTAPLPLLMAAIKYASMVLGFISRILKQKLLGAARARAPVSDPPRCTPGNDHFEPPARLQTVLTIEHILLNIVEGMCYEDVVNLSLASRDVREAVFPSRDLSYRVPKLRDRCCFAGKKNCPYCINPMCESCMKKEYWPGIPSWHHADHCRPCCTQCYVEKCFGDPNFRRARIGGLKCMCDCLERRSDYREVCGTCLAIGSFAVTSSKDNEYREKIKQLELTKGLCAGCSTTLYRKPVFWICYQCGVECRDVLHPAFAKATQEHDIERQGTPMIGSGRVFQRLYKSFRRLF